MNILDPSFKYTPSKDMKEDYLREKFRLIRSQLEEKRNEHDQGSRVVIAPVFRVGRQR